MTTRVPPLVHSRIAAQRAREHAPICLEPQLPVPSATIPPPDRQSNPVPRPDHDLGPLPGNVLTQPTRATCP